MNFTHDLHRAGLAALQWAGWLSLIVCAAWVTIHILQQHYYGGPLS